MKNEGFIKGDLIHPLIFYGAPQEHITLQKKFSNKKVKKNWSL